MPGFGGSDLTCPRPPSIATQGEILGEMLAAWGLARPAVVAHDFGGAVALRAHLLHAVQYRALVLMNIVVMRPWGSGFFEHVKCHVSAFRGVPAHIHAAIVGAYVDSALAVSIAADDRDALIAPWLSAAGQEAFYTQFGLADERFTAEIEPLFGSIRCPVTLFWGDADPWIPLDRGEAFAHYAGVALRRLAGLGHLPQLEAPDRVAADLLDALEPA